MLIVNYAGLAYINTVNASSDCFGEANHLNTSGRDGFTRKHIGSMKPAGLLRRARSPRLHSLAPLPLPGRKFVETVQKIGLGLAANGDPYWISGYNIQQNGILSFSA
ncbi:hypothetical protein PCH_Pc20g05440 [Penicillium rubens Wisconsin 54-1255]|jgi:hypothetical protein|uniref:Uncharacterized protein n=1 Tax=Penicillium rubens (strain ATCC 28089 / DSM 1075 / NRRL 1951 / Wisconsin 54-1255) TaxID=500485 RepID=B6HEV3_PENRW|nr:hypothetical protein PCH_Pc20g05440 [Penicillium rubens Wisconsin 54-1255]